jgi:hypothetical protein
MSVETHSRLSEDVKVFLEKLLISPPPPSQGDGSVCGEPADESLQVEEMNG